jgi:hypothetical protein
MQESELSGVQCNGSLARQFSHWPERHARSVENVAPDGTTLGRGLYTYLMHPTRLGFDLQQREALVLAERAVL